MNKDEMLWNWTEFVTLSHEPKPEDIMNMIADLHKRIKAIEEKDGK